MSSIEVASLREVLEHIRQLKLKGSFATKSWAYDSMEHFVLEHGEEFTPIELPPEFEYAEKQRCYANAMELIVWHPELTYVEGYGMRFGLPVHHAWCVDPEGRLIDVTWHPEEGRGPLDAEYLGVRFSLRRAYDALVNGSGSILDDWERGWPIFQEPFDSEEEK